MLKKITDVVKALKLQETQASHILGLLGFPAVSLHVASVHEFYGRSNPASLLSPSQMGDFCVEGKGIPASHLDRLYILVGAFLRHSFKDLPIDQRDDKNDLCGDKRRNQGGHRYWKGRLQSWAVHLQGRYGAPELAPDP